MTIKLEFTPNSRIGKWTFIENTPKVGRHRMGLFKCDCGKIKRVRLTHIRNGTIMSCGCAHTAPMKIGDKKGRLTLLNNRIRKNNHGQWIGEFRCDCGKTFETCVYRVNQGITKSCGCFSKEHSLDNINLMRISNTILGDTVGKHNLFCHYRTQAKRRKINFDLNEIQFIEITGMNCHYCGSQPKHISKSAGGQYLYNGIDRVDSSIGYTTANCIPSCGMCNRMKLNYNYNEFLAHCNKIAANINSHQHVR